jgi:hypothetical protein
MKVTTTKKQKTYRSAALNCAVTIPDDKPAKLTPDEMLAAILKLSEDLSEDLGDRYARSRIGQAVQDIKDRLNGKA